MPYLRMSLCGLPLLPCMTGLYASFFAFLGAFVGGTLGFLFEGCINSSSLIFTWLPLRFLDTGKRSTALLFSFLKSHFISSAVCSLSASFYSQCTRSWFKGGLAGSTVVRSILSIAKAFGPGTITLAEALGFSLSLLRRLNDTESSLLFTFAICCSQSFRSLRFSIELSHLLFDFCLILATRA